MTMTATLQRTSTFVEKAHLCNVAYSAQHRSSELPRAQVLQALSGRWKIPILDLLCAGDRHFAAIERALQPISRRMLSRSLRELERDGLVARDASNIPGGTVTYRIADLGRQAVTVVDALRPPERSSVDEL